MIDLFGLIGAGSTLTLVGLCYKMSTERNSKYVSKDVCDLSHKQSEIRIDAVRNILENKIIDLKDDLTEIKSDVKTLLRNGKIK